MDIDTSNIEGFEREQIIGQSLLGEPSLLTPRLAAFFGPMIIKKLQLEWHGENLLRSVTLVQKLTGLELVEAQLNIFCANLPDPVRAELENSDQLFGQILINHTIKVAIKELTLLRVASDSLNEDRLGRRHHMVKHSDGAVLCEVNELLAPEHVLAKARAKFESLGNKKQCGMS